MNLTMNDILNVKTNSLIFKLLDAFSDPARITFEIVETVDVEDYDELSEFSKRVRGYGAKIAIDDFGTGFSNFAHLISIDFDYLYIME